MRLPAQPNNRNQPNRTSLLSFLTRLEPSGNRVQLDIDHFDRRHLRRCRSDPQPPLEFLQGRRSAKGDYFHFPVSEIVRMSRNYQFPRVLRNGTAIEHTLNTSGNEKSPSAHRLSKKDSEAFWRY